MRVLKPSATSTGLCPTAGSLSVLPCTLTQLTGSECACCFPTWLYCKFNGQSLHLPVVLQTLGSWCLLLSLMLAEQQQGLAAYLLTQIPLMHAAAYTLAKVAELSSWKPVMQPEYELVPFSSCCSLASNLPRGFVQAAKAWGESLKQQGTTAQVA